MLGFGIELVVYGFSVNDLLDNFDASEASQLKFKAAMAFVNSLFEDLLVF
ncbi:hypothetical protein [Synechococcus sp. MU1643]|nr:hypothetical protein [Synechococcus sp. MU1643]